MSSQSYFTKSTESKSYVSGYDVFLKRTNFREKILEKFKDTFPLKIKNKTGFRVLDIGCGNGYMTSRYILRLKELLGEIPISLTLLEPSKNALEMAKAEVTDLVRDLKEINLSAEDYFKSESKENYDLIIASHVFYHISVSTISQIIRFLDHDGALAIMMGAKIHPLRTHPHLKSISKHGDSDALKELLSSLIERGAVSSSIVSVKTDLDLNGLWSSGELSEEGKSFFGFTYNTEINELPHASVEALNGLLSEVLTNQNGVVYPHHEILWVMKA